MRPRRRSALAAAALLAAVATTSAAGRGVESGSNDSSTSLSFDLRATRQVVAGFGSSERVWSDPHVANAAGIEIPGAAQEAILRSLYGRLGLTRVRNVLDQGVQKERGGSFTYTGKGTDAHVAFVKQAKAFGLRTFFPGPVYVEPWMSAEDTGAYVTWAMAVLRRWRSLGLEPPYYAPLNEPQVDGDFPPRWMRDVVLQLGQALRREGFRTKLVIPDDENPADAYRRAAAVLADPRARRYVGALAYHVYKGDTGDMVRMRSLAARYRLPLWMTEYSNTGYRDWRSSFDWAVRMHDLLALGNVSAIDYLWGFFGSYAGTDAYVSVEFDGPVYRSFRYTPVAYMTGQYSRFVRPGFVRIAGGGPEGSVLASAYRGPGKVVVVATNTDDVERAVSVVLRGGTALRPLAVVRSSDSERWRSLPPPTLRESRFAASLPAKSITTFVLSRG